MADAVGDEVGLIATREGLDELVRHLRGAGRFAFDTEFVSEDTFEPILCLVQVATTERLAVVDPIAIGDIATFWGAVTDPAVEVVMHAAGEDLRICRFQAGAVPARIVDVQIAAGLLGYGYPLSLGNLIQHVLRVTLAGGETRTDWRRRPLSPGQLRYALDDVRHLLVASDRISERLDALGRLGWAEAEYAAFLEQVRGRDDEQRWRRLPGLHQLSRRGLEAARLLAEWRIEEARRSNRPVRQVMRDDLLVAIAKRQPANRRDLEALRDFNRPHLLARSPEILAAVARAAEAAADALPDHAERHDDGPGIAMVVSLLAATLSRCCAEQHLAPALVGSAGDLKDLIRWNVDGRPDGARPALAAGWRDEVCGRTLLDVLDGRRALRVVDPTAEVPVAIEPVAGPGG